MENEYKLSENEQAVEDNSTTEYGHHYCEWEVVMADLDQCHSLFKSWRTNTAFCISKMKVVHIDGNNYLECEEESLCQNTDQYGLNNHGNAGQGGITCRKCIATYNRMVKQGVEVFQ